MLLLRLIIDLGSSCQQFSAICCPRVNCEPITDRDCICMIVCVVFFRSVDSSRMCFCYLLLCFIAVHFFLWAKALPDTNKQIKIDWSIKLLRLSLPYRDRQQSCLALLCPSALWATTSLLWYYLLVPGSATSVEQQCWKVPSNNTEWPSISCLAGET